MTKDNNKILRKKSQRPSKFYEPVDPAKKTHRDAEKRRSVEQLHYIVCTLFCSWLFIQDPSTFRITEFYKNKSKILFIRRYNIALWFNKLQDLMDPGKSRKYKREHILTWTTNRIWVSFSEYRRFKKATKVCSTRKLF